MGGQLDRTEVELKLPLPLGQQQQQPGREDVPLSIEGKEGVDSYLLHLLLPWHGLEVRSDCTITPPRLCFLSYRLAKVTL